jgi:hypothetical protein
VPAIALRAVRRVLRASREHSKKKQGRKRHSGGCGGGSEAAVADCGGSNLLVSNRPDKLLACARRSKASTVTAICVCGCTE